MKRLTLVLIFLLMMTIPVVGQESPPVVPDSPVDMTQVTLTEVVDGLFRPLYITHAGDGSNRLFVLQQSGQIWIVKDGALQERTFMDLSSIVSQSQGYTERGLLGMAFHPNFADNGLFYLNYTDSRIEHATKIVEFQVTEDDPDRATIESGRVLMIIGQPFSNHNGGQLAFGPDGYLYIGVGDGGSANDPLGAGQNPGTLLGNILRIDVDNATDTREYAIPQDNPVVDNPNLAMEIWAWGLRNPWRFSFDRATGDLYIADVGQNVWEEINFQPADSPGGENYGWNAFEGNVTFSGADPASEVVMPAMVYDHSEGCSVTGGYVYRGEAILALQGYYLFGDYCNGRVWAGYPDASGEWSYDLLLNVGSTLSSFGEDEAGELYVLAYDGGRVYRIDPTERDTAGAVNYWRFIWLDSGQPEGAWVELFPMAYLERVESNAAAGADPAENIGSALQRIIDTPDDRLWETDNMTVDDVRVEGTAAIVTLSGDVMFVGGAVAAGAKMQLAMTVFEQPGIETVLITLNGANIANLVIDHPSQEKPDDFVYTRDSFADYLDSP